MNEAQVVDAFCRYLASQGWQDIRTEVDYVDVVAHRDGVTLYVEAKGKTGSTGTDVDTMYGQLLRRMQPEDEPGVRYAVVVPHTALPAVLRVPASVRARLKIDVYSVHEDGRVELHGSTPLTDPDNVGWVPAKEGE